MGIRGSIDFSLYGGCSANAMGFSMPCASVMAGQTITLGPAMVPALILTIASAVLLLAGTIAGYARKMEPKRVGQLFLIAGIAGIAAPILLMMTLGPALVGANLGAFTQGAGSGPTGSFWGSTTTTAIGVPFTIDWGPGLGWYASFVAAILGITGGISAIKGKPVPVTSPPVATAVVYYPVAYGAPQYAPPYAQAPYGQATQGQGAYAPTAVQGPPQQATKNCPACGTLNWATSGTCGRCGAPMSAAVTQAVTAQVAAPAQQPATKNCPTCGTLNWATSMACGKCGAPLGA
jgi:hypothetical protein